MFQKQARLVLGLAIVLDLFFLLLGLAGRPGRCSSEVGGLMSRTAGRGYPLIR